MEDFRFTSLYPDTTSLPASMEFCGALRITSSDTRFGGFSGISFMGDGEHYVAVSDGGYYMTGALEFDKRHRLINMDMRNFGELVEQSLSRVGHKSYVDAEAITAITPLKFLVSFERQHRLWHYSWKQGRLEHTKSPMLALPPLPQIALNDGFESMAQLNDGRLLLIAEQVEAGTSTHNPDVRSDHTTLLISDRGGWRKSRYPISDGFLPSDVTVLPGGDLLVLERAFSFFSGLRSRIMRLPYSQLQQPFLRPELLVDVTDVTFADNTEGLDVRVMEDGRLMMLMISDDNYRLWQHTYVTALCYDPESSALQ